MALSFTEKRSLQKSLTENTAQLRSGSLGFKEKRALQTANAGILAQLRGTAAPVIPAVPEVVTPEINQNLFDLQQGKFNSLEPMAFLGKLKEIAGAINDIEPLKAPAIAYIEANKDKVSAVMESALQEAFGKLWGGVL